MDDFIFLDAIAQAELVRKSEVQPSELVAAAIRRIETLNPRLNAVITPLFDQARAAVEGGLPEGPLRGVPFLLKDLLAACAGTPMSDGSSFVQGLVHDFDSELVARFKRAGLVILGKTNVPEFGSVATTEPKRFGPARNPWNSGHTTGGSSGGSAAAVAAGMVPCAHANDGGGSIRIPASCCGLFGLKPTRARNPLGPEHGDVLLGFVVEHAVTRSVRDSAALLDATAGPDLGDPYWAPRPTRPFLEEVGADPGRLRIAVSTDTYTGVPVHADCIAAVEDVAKLCADLGHDIVEAQPRLDGETISRAFIGIFAAGFSATIEDRAKLLGKEPTPEQIEPLNWAMYEMGRYLPAANLLLALADLQRAARDVARFCAEYDVWLTPTCATPPPRLGALDTPEDDPMEGLNRSARFAPYTQVANFTGQPAMSVPLNWNAAGLPIGAHFHGRFGDEATLFRLASQLETARPWANRHPAD